MEDKKETKEMLEFFWEVEECEENRPVNSTILVTTPGGIEGRPVAAVFVCGGL